MVVTKYDLRHIAAVVSFYFHTDLRYLLFGVFHCHKKWMLIWWMFLGWWLCWHLCWVLILVVGFGQLLSFASIVPMPIAFFLEYLRRCNSFRMQNKYLQLLCTHQIWDFVFLAGQSKCFTCTDVIRIVYYMKYSVHCSTHDIWRVNCYLSVKTDGEYVSNCGE